MLTIVLTPVTRIQPRTVYATALEGFVGLNDAWAEFDPVASTLTLYPDASGESIVTHADCIGQCCLIINRFRVAYNDMMEQMMDAYRSMAAESRMYH